MVIGTDTSFLFSLYGNDKHSPAAVSWAAGNTEVVSISAFNRFELVNALRFAECRNTIPKGAAARQFALFEIDLRAGRLVERRSSLADILAEAFLLSAAHTLAGGHRGFDILHVAAARIMGATHFLTFDGNQRRLAAAVGLDLPL